MQHSIFFPSTMFLKTSEINWLYTTVNGNFCNETLNLFKQRNFTKGSNL